MWSPYPLHPVRIDRGRLGSMYCLYSIPWLFLLLPVDAWIFTYIRCCMLLHEVHQQKLKLQLNIHDFTGGQTLATPSKRLLKIIPTVPGGCFPFSFRAVWGFEADGRGAGPRGQAGRIWRIAAHAVRQFDRSSKETPQKKKARWKH